MSPCFTSPNHDRYIVYNGYYKVMSNIPKMVTFTNPCITSSDFFFSLDVMTRVTGKSPIDFDDKFPAKTEPPWGMSIIIMFDFQRLSLLFMCGVDMCR